MISAKIICDSIGGDAPRLTTFELEYPRFIHAELMTHRVFSRNASSSRAIPVGRMLEKTLADPTMPSEWRMEEPGMQGFALAPPEVAAQAERLTLDGLAYMADIARKMAVLGLHKQHINRETERWQHIKVVVTSCQFKNWFGLRDHPAADPTIRALAAAMREAYDASEPTHLLTGQWHLPYVTQEDFPLVAEFKETSDLTLLDIIQRMSAARCARVSYNNFKGVKPKIASDLALYEKLVVSQPVHASPTEHQATPDSILVRRTGRWSNPELHGNLPGWLQFRKYIPFENLETVD